MILNVLYPDRSLRDPYSIKRRASIRRSAPRADPDTQWHKVENVGAALGGLKAIQDGSDLSGGWLVQMLAESGAVS